MQTIVVPLSEESKTLPQRILEKRTMSLHDFAEKHGSGTLRDNLRLGFYCGLQGISERCAYVFGYGFSPYKSFHVSFNNSITECDEQAYTLAGRLFKRYNAWKRFPEDYFEIKYVIIENESGSRDWEGIAVIIRETSAKFIPDSCLVLAKVVEYDRNSHSWKNVINFA